MTSQISQLIIIQLDQNDGEIRGTEHLAEDLLGCSDHAWVRRKLSELESADIISIIRGNGRGHKNIIRRNRNSPGYPRRRS